MAQLQSTSVTGSLIISGSSTTLVSSGSTVMDIQGSVGQLFSVTDSLTGVLMSVNDISGLPILEVSSDDKVVMGTFGAEGLIVTGSNVNIGKISSNTHKVTGSLNVSGSQNLVGDLAITTTSTNPSITITDTSSNDPHIRFVPATTTNAFAVGIDDSDSDKFKISYGSNAVLGTNDRLTIDTSGNVGIGTTSPGCTLSVVGSICSSDQIRGANIITAGTVCAASNICTGGISRGANLCATTSICGPLIVSSGTNRGANLCATTSICGPLIVSSGTNRGADLCATTSVCSPRGIFSSCVDSCIYTSNAGGAGVKVGTTEVNDIYFDDPINGGTWYYRLHGGLTTDRALL